MKKRVRQKDKRRRFEVIYGEGRRFSFSQFKEALLFYFCLLIALIIIVQLGYHWLGEQLLAWRLQVVTAEPGIIEYKHPVSGIITRNEEVFTAPDNGLILELKFPEGKRVPAGSELIRLGLLSDSELEAVAGIDEGSREDFIGQVIDYWQTIFDIEADEEDDHPGERLDNNHAVDEIHLEEVEFKTILIIENKKAGHLSYYIDGMENIAGPCYELGDLEEGNIRNRALQEGDLVRKGEPLFKVVDNWYWYFSAVLPLYPGKAIAELPAVELAFEFAGGELVQARQHYSEVNEAAGEVKITFVINKQVAGFEKVRQGEAMIIYKRLQGIIVPAAALFEKDNKTGLFLNQSGKVVFHPVTLIEREDDIIIVEGLPPYSMVISRPELVREGQRLN